MSEQAIPSDVLAFIEQRIATVPHLEALLLMWEFRSQVWTEELLAQRLYTDVANARRILADLEREGLIVATTVEGTSAHQVAPGQDELLSRVATSYRKQLVTIARFIHSKGSPAMREFSRAFQFKDNK
jgi:hypothetical protein